MDRKYKQHGYMSDDKPKKQEKRPPHDGRPRQEQFGPRTPRMVGTVSRMRCSNCGAVLQPNVDPNAKCPRCAFDLHCCKQCRYFDSAARYPAHQRERPSVGNSGRRRRAGAPAASRIASAAKQPLRTAPSIVAGQPVAVQSPAR